MTGRQNFIPENAKTSPSSLGAIASATLIYQDEIQQIPLSEPDRCRFHQDIDGKWSKYLFSWYINQLCGTLI